MKNLSSKTISSEQPRVLSGTAAPDPANPRASFSPFQWFLYEARNTVYFTAFSTEEFDRDKLFGMVAQMVSLAPQLAEGYVGARPDQPLPKHLLDAITSLEETDDFTDYPDKWISDGQELYMADDLPLFRVKVVSRRGGPDNQGRASMIMVQSSHSLMEGSDSALLTRSLPSNRGAGTSIKTKVPLITRWLMTAVAAISVPAHLISAHLLAPKTVEMGFASFAFDRAQLRRVSNRLGVRQRSLMFALVAYALNDGGKGFSAKKIRAFYTTLNSEHHDLDDDFFRVRSVQAFFDVSGDLEAFVKIVDAAIENIESKDISSVQLLLNAMLRAHRALAGIFPFLYSRRFFLFNGNVDLILTLVPPHRTYGDLTNGIIEPVYCGSYHPGSNMCAFVPARKTVTFNLSIRTKHLAHAAKIPALMDQLDV